MATTTPFPFGDYVHGDKPEARALIAQYESALADSDKAGETDAASYHDGRTEVFADALFLLLEIPLEAWEQYQQGTLVVSPANDGPAHVMESFEHVPGAEFAEAHDYFTRSQKADSGSYTLMPASGWYVYDGPRLVTLHWWSTTGTHVQDRQVEHAELLRDVSNHMDMLAQQSTTSPEYLMSAAAFDLILSDAQTGTSLYSWSPMRRLVNQVITWIYTGDSGVLVTTEWAEF
jgi:hypothetical protein